jgi:hypothetical protein
MVRAMEDRMRQLALAARPLTRPLISRDPTAVRRRLALYEAAVRRLRTLALMPVPVAVTCGASGSEASDAYGSRGALDAARVSPADGATEVVETIRALVRTIGDLNE